MIISCKHHNSMGLCSSCSQQIENEEYNRRNSEYTSERNSRLKIAIEVCKEEGLLWAADILRAKIS